MFVIASGGLDVVIGNGWADLRGDVAERCVGSKGCSS